MVPAKSSSWTSRGSRTCRGPSSRERCTARASATGLVRVQVPVAKKDVVDHRARFRGLARRSQVRTSSR